MQKRLTDALVAALVSNGRDLFVFDTQQSGFAVRVTPAGAKVLQARGYVAGKKRVVPLGRHPELSVAVGRELALQVLADMRRGLDPVLELKTRQAAVVAGDMVVSALIDKWLADYVRPKLKPDTVTDYEQLSASR